MEQATGPDLEAALQADDNGTTRAQVLTRLQAMRDSCQAAKRQLCDRETYRRVEAANVAVNAAIRIIETFPQRRGEPA